jgi:hypothetical protein
VEFARGVGEVRRDEEARAMWREVYPVLSRDVPGLLGAVTSRAEAQVTRLSLLYALLDKSDVIRAEHLEAALAAWGYAFASCRHVFGDALGDPVADEILRALKTAGADGLTRSDIRDLFQRNQKAERIGQALAALLAAGLARTDTRPTDGRSAEVWFAV